MTIRSRPAAAFAKRLILGGCTFISSGCQLVRDPTTLDVDDGRIAVHAMLVAGERRIAVLATRYEPTGTGGGFGAAYGVAPVAGADVRVSGAGQNIVLRSDGRAESCVDEHGYGVNDIMAPLAPGCYTGSAEDGIVAGALYELHVTLGDGTIVTGEAEVPRPTTIRTPEAGADLEVGWSYDETDPAPSHTLTWTDAGPDRAVRLRLEVDGCGAAWTTHEPGPGDLEEPPNGFLLDAIDLTGRDSASVGGWYLLCEEQPMGPVDGALQLAVFNLAYAQYLDTLARGQSLPLPEASIGLTGAVGAFTGAAITRQPVRLILR